MKWILFSIGMIMVFMGSYVTIWAGDSKELFEELSKHSDRDIRSIGLFLFGVGMIIVAFVWFIVPKG
ncbi:DUF2065 family protein [bacterium]|nr:DUF2065 family protein [bacterium]